jgi:DNA-binding transcriptional LysR family regulator
MNIVFIETFVTLARLRSFRATAKALYATPAAVSLRLKNLEGELGVELVDRSAKHFQLTAMGESLLDYAKAVLIATRKMELAAHNTVAIKGRIRLGVVETAVHTWLPDFMNQINKDHPELEIDLTVDTSNVLQKRLLADELDIIARIGSIDDPSIISIPLAMYSMQWIVHKEFFPSTPDNLARSILSIPIITFARGTQSQLAVEEFLIAMADKENFPVDQMRLTCSHSVATIVQLVRNKFGVATIPRLFAKESLLTGELIELPLQPKLPSVLLFLCRHVDAPTKVLDSIETVRNTCQQYGKIMGENFIKILL